MSIKRLVRIIAPPAKPRGTASASSLAKIERKLGTSRPTDLVDIWRTYGRGYFQYYDHDISIYNAFAPKDVSRLLEDLKIFREIRDDFPGEVPFDIHPAKPGLLPFGTDGNGGSLFFLTQGQPDRWPIYLNRARSAVFEMWKPPLGTFLAKAFAQEIECVLWQLPDENSEDRLTFEPRN